MFEGGRGKEGGSRWGNVIGDGESVQSDKMVTRWMMSADGLLSYCLFLGRYKIGSERVSLEGGVQ